MSISATKQRVSYVRNGGCNHSGTKDNQLGLVLVTSLYPQALLVGGLQQVGDT